jgi:hypothetical protein
VADILTDITGPVAAPRRDDLDQTPAAELRQRIRLAQSLLGHRADDGEVLFQLLSDVLAGVPLYVLSQRQVRP